MPRNKLDETLKLRNQVAIMLSDRELDDLNKAADVAQLDFKANYPRARFIKDAVMMQVRELNDRQSEVEPQDEPTKPVLLEVPQNTDRQHAGTKVSAKPILESNDVKLSNQKEQKARKRPKAKPAAQEARARKPAKKVKSLTKAPKGKAKRKR